MNEIPTTSTTVLMLPGLFSVIGVFVFIFALISFKQRKRLPLGRWVAYLCFVVGLFFGWQKMWAYVQPSNEGHLYRSALENKSRLLNASHYIAFLLPLLCILLAIPIERQLRKIVKRRAEF